MFGFSRCRYLSTTVDQHINRDMGTRSVEEFVANMMGDVENPEQMDALAFQFLCVARRIKLSDKEFAARGGSNRGIPDRSVAWKAAWKTAKEAAEKIRERRVVVDALLAYSELVFKHKLGAPGKLYNDVLVPRAVRTSFDRPEVFVGTYKPNLKHDAVYELTIGRNLTVWFKDANGYQCEIGGKQFEVLMNLGQLIPVKIA